MPNDIPENPTAKPDLSWEQRGKLVEVLAKVLIYISSAFYVAGIIVVNSQLSRYGYHSLSLLQIQYVLAGTWALMPIAICVLAKGYGESLSRQFITNLGEKTSFTYKMLGENLNTQLVNFLKPLSTGYYAAIVLASSFGFLILFESFFRVRQTTQQDDMSWLLVFIVAALIGGYLDSLVKVFNLVKQYAPQKIIDLVFSATVLAGLFLIYLALFGLLVYSQIPQQLGGGQPNSVRILIDPANSASLQSVGFSFSAQKPVSDPVQLLIDTDKEYVFILADSPARVSRELVKAVIFEPIH